MIKNQLYPYIEEYINSFLYGFTKEQLDVGLLNGQIKFENLNLRPDSVNNKLDDNNFPFWLKAGLISKINLGCSLMNFIGEKPIEANMEGINIIVTPSYKWIIQNLDSFVYEDATEIKNEYSPYENNSVNIFGKKINVLDNSIFNRDKYLKFFKDQTKIANFLNQIFSDCFKFYYSKNYTLILKLKNVHIRFEDDQLINYTGNIALGCKIDLFELTLSSEGTMKKNNLKITKLDFYWENNANILIPSNILYDSIRNGVLNDNYYSNLKKIKFENFSYKKDTKFILQNLNCLCNFGTKAINQGKMDIFGKKENNYKLYIQFASNEIKINLFPDLEVIRNNFKKFVREYLIIGQAQEFKPMKKPYNSKNRHFIEILKNIKKAPNTKLAKKFPYKRKMMVRDWLYYFYWCHKCQSSIFNNNLSPLRLEFTRFYNLFYKDSHFDALNNLENEKENNLKEKNKDEDGKPIWTRENPNPDNINLLFITDIKIKGLNLNIYPFIFSKKNNEFVFVKINNFDSKLSLNKDKFEFSFTIKSIILGPNKLNSGEKVIIRKNSMKKNSELSNVNNSNDVESDKGINGLLQKYNPNYSKQLNFIDKAMKKINKSNNNDGDKSSNKERNKNINIKNKNEKVFEEKEILNKNHNKINSFKENKNTQLIPTGKVCPLNLVEIYSDINTNNNSPCFQFKYIKFNNNNSMDILKLMFGIIRVNFFSEYILKCVNILNDYRHINKKTLIKSIKKDSCNYDASFDKTLLETKKYFLDKLNKMPEKKKTKQIKNYITYLQNEINKNKDNTHESDNYEIKYLLGIFSKGVDVAIDYDNLECIYYSNKNNKVCGKIIMPPPMFNFKFNSSNTSFKLYDFEFEINELENTNIFFNTLHTIIEDKFKMTRILIEPCISQIKKEMENQKSEVFGDDKNKNNDLEKKLNKLIKNNLNINNLKKNLKADISENEKENKEQNDSQEMDIIQYDNEYYNINENQVDNNIKYKINSFKSFNEVKQKNNISLNTQKNINKKGNDLIKHKTIQLKKIEIQHENKIINKSTDNNSNISNNLNKKVIKETKKENISVNKENKNGKINILNKKPVTKILNDKKNNENITSVKNPHPIPNKKIVKGKKQILKKKLNLNPQK